MWCKPMSNVNNLQLVSVFFIYFYFFNFSRSLDRIKLIENNDNVNLPDNGEKYRLKARAF